MSSRAWRTFCGLFLGGVFLVLAGPTAGGQDKKDDKKSTQSRIEKNLRALEDRIPEVAPARASVALAAARLFEQDKAAALA